MVHLQVSSSDRMFKAKAKLGNKLRTSRSTRTLPGGINHKINARRVAQGREDVTARREERARAERGAHAAVVEERARAERVALAAVAEGAPGVDQGDPGAALAADALETGAALAARGGPAAHRAGAIVAAPAAGGEAQAGAAGAGGEDGGHVAALAIADEEAATVVEAAGKVVAALQDAGRAAKVVAALPPRAGKVVAALPPRAGKDVAALPPIEGAGKGVASMMQQCQTIPELVATKVAKVIAVGRGRAGPKQPMVLRHIVGRTTTGLRTGVNVTGSMIATIATGTVTEIATGDRNETRRKQAKETIEMATNGLETGTVPSATTTASHGRLCAHNVARARMAHQHLRASSQAIKEKEKEKTGKT